MNISSTATKGKKKMNNYREQALLEYNSEKTSAHQGGVFGRPFWNLTSSQFMFAPAFQFPRVPNGKGYLFSAEDKDGRIHTFKSDKPTASLAPIWGDIPEGIVCLKVESLDKNGERLNLIGARTFYKSTPFPGRDAFPPKACSYRECALAAFKFAYNDSVIQYWLTHGKPKPDFAHNAYPAKTFSSVIKFMVNYAKLDPSKKEEALTIGRIVADYMLSITQDGDHPLAGLPPTYCLDTLDLKVVEFIAPAAIRCKGTTMMIYPIKAADAYLALGEATGDKKYTDAAMRIMEYYKKNGKQILSCSVTGGGADGGIDGVIKTRDELGFIETTMVQTKNRHKLSSETDVRGFYGAVRAMGGTRGIFATSADFHYSAATFLEGLDDCIGINGDRIFKLAVDYEYGIKRISNKLTIDGKML